MKRSSLNDWVTLAASAALAAFTGLIAGAIFAGEAGCLRQWVSALSGWAAGIGAIGVGVFTIHPLVRQVRIQEHAARTTIIINAYETVNRIKEAQTNFRLLHTFISLPDRFIPKDASEASEKSKIIYNNTLKMRQHVRGISDIVRSIIVVDGSIFAHRERVAANNSIHNLEFKLMELEFLADMYISGAQYFTEKDSKVFESIFTDIRKDHIDARSCIWAYVDALETLL